KSIIMNVAAGVKWIAVMTAKVVAFTVSKTAMLAWTVASKAWTAAVWLAQAAMAALNVVMRLSPIGLIITAVMALAAAAVWLWKNWDNLPEAFAQLWETIKEAFGKAWDYIKELMGFDPVAMVSEAWDGLADYFSNLFGGIWDNFMGTIGKMGDYMKGGANWLLGGMGMFDDNEELKEQVNDAPKVSDPAPAVKGKPMAKGGQINPVAPVTRTTNQNTYQITIDAKGLTADELATAFDKRLSEERRKNEQQQRARNKD
ncbi:MAG: hypothetical protein ACRCUF_20925, partial [Aeromonas sobria]